jgi:hypothetical protein
VPKPAPKPAGPTERLAEYSARCSEIAQRSTYQQALVALNLTTTGTIIGFVVGKSDAPRTLLLIVPIVSSTLGLIWLDHHRNIQLIAKYVKNVLWPWTPSWEAWRADERGAEEVYYWVSMCAVYAAGSIGSLAIGHPRPHQEGPGVWALWSAGLVMTVVFVVAFVLEGRRPP